jgi:hypothetical protein
MVMVYVTLRKMWICRQHHVPDSINSSQTSSSSSSSSSFIFPSLRVMSVKKADFGRS